MKNSFILYKDQLSYINKLTREQKGLLLETIYQYVTGQDLPELDQATDIVFEAIKASLIRDKKKWDIKSETNRELGKIGGLASATKRKEQQANAIESNRIQANATPFKRNQPVSVSVSVSDSEYINTSEVSEELFQSIPIGDKEFNILWNEYPKHDGKKAALKHFKASVKTLTDLEDITMALKNYLAHIEKEKTIPKYIKNGSTWFNNWKDWVVINQAKKLTKEEYIKQIQEINK